MVRDSVGIDWVWIDFCGLPDGVFIRGKEREILGKRTILKSCVYVLYYSEQPWMGSIQENMTLLEKPARGEERFVRAVPGETNGRKFLPFSTGNIPAG